ncbi:hypothetical protein RJ639_015869 [Escallonia herrerae]|uniref:Uncharacterized protein n=1 Tax=Escallonia herrerae TaxID=1293975 RepID=A0AA88VB05_9ASTE|nr:hypothetical protein RJ639_015869 [Escallonia herrerae]
MRLVTFRRPMRVLPTSCKGDSRRPTAGRVALQVESGVLTTRLHLESTLERGNGEGFKTMEKNPDLFVAAFATTDALVQLGCGGPVVANAATNGSGFFSIVLNPSPFPLSNVQPSRQHTALYLQRDPASHWSPAVPLAARREHLIGLLNVTDLIPAGFSFV